jgi:hypothetical protein
MESNNNKTNTLVELDPALLAREGNGAVQVDASPSECPPIVTIIGPIKAWWSEWDSPRHQEYTAWRDAVRVALVKAGCAVYSPHRAIQGRWNESLQQINDRAIAVSDLVVDMTPQGVEARGTAGERSVAEKNNVSIYDCPPSGPDGISALLERVALLGQAPPDYQKLFEAAGFSIIGAFYQHGHRQEVSVEFTAYSTDVCDEVELGNGEVFCLESDIDCTDDEEREEGLSYSKVTYRRKNK